MSKKHVPARPYPWPWNGDLRPGNTALIVIDMQTDFCGKGGYVDAMGYDLSLTRAPIEPIRKLLAAARRAGASGCHTGGQRSHPKDQNEATQRLAGQAQNGQHAETLTQTAYWRLVGRVVGSQREVNL